MDLPNSIFTLSTSYSSHLSQIRVITSNLNRSPLNFQSNYLNFMNSAISCKHNSKNYGTANFEIKTPALNYRIMTRFVGRVSSRNDNLVDFGSIGTIPVWMMVFFLILGMMFSFICLVLFSLRKWILEDVKTTRNIIERDIQNELSTDMRWEDTISEETDENLSHDKT